MAGVYTDQAGDEPQAAEEELQEEVESGGAHCARYVDIAVELGYCGRERADEALRAFLESGADAAEFGGYLCDEGVVTREQSRACERALRGHSTIGGFSILEKVGQGGMGTVFRARQISMDRIVAVKILAPKYAQDPGFKERFLNEARTCAKLSHLNIINGIDCGEDSGYAYFAMEFVDGRTVKQILKEKERLEPDEAFKIVRQICDALSYARKMNMVHRDIKPDNIMLTQSGTAKLCDLGLAIQAEETEQNVAVQVGANESGSKADAVRSGDGEASSGDAAEDGAAKPKDKERKLALGTPHYMSPEQARGEKNIDARSDIYSLGATFYHLITGQTMFEGSTSTEIMTHHVLSEAPNPCSLDPEISPMLGAIISKMTAKSPNDRYPGADELIADLEAVKNGQLPSAVTFIAKTSTAILPPAELRRRIRTSTSWAQRIPTIAAVILFGVMAYYLVQWIGKPGNNPPPINGTLAENTAHVVTPSVSAPVTPTTTPPVVIPTETPKVVATQTVTVPAKTVEPVVTATTKAPATTEKVAVVDPVKPPVPDTPPMVVTPPPPPPVVIPEIPRPDLKLTPDIVYARFLKEEDERSAQLQMDAAKLYAAMKELSLKPEFALAKDDIAAELADLKGGWEFESKALKRIADQKAEVEFDQKTHDKWGVPKGKAMGFEEARGLHVELPSGVAFYVAPSTIPIDTILAKSGDNSPLARTQFNYIRANNAGVFALLAQLPPGEQLRWDRKFKMRTAKEIEMVAREAFNNLKFVAEKKSWKTFSDMVIDYLKDYGNTMYFRDHSKEIKQWQDTALNALAPPGRWAQFFHAASAHEVIGQKGEEMVELIYDFKTPEQAQDFYCAYGKLRIENGQLIVPEGGGDVGCVRFNAPFTHLESFKAEGESLHHELRPFGVVFVTAAQANGPNPGNPMLKLDPETKLATLENMATSQQTFAGPPPAFNWLKPTTIAFATVKGEFNWSVDGKPVGSSKLPTKEFSVGGWIALWGAQGNHAWSHIEIVLQPDDVWFKRPVKAPTPTPPTPPPVP